MRAHRIIQSSLLLLATGCISAAEAGRAADIPYVPRPYPMPHPPDAPVVARETEWHWEKQLNRALMKPLTAVNWGILGIAIVF